MATSKPAVATGGPPGAEWVFKIYGIGVLILQPGCHRILVIKTSATSASMNTYSCLLQDERESFWSMNCYAIFIHMVSYILFTNC